MYRTNWPDAKREAAILNRKVFMLPTKYLRFIISPERGVWASACEGINPADGYWIELADSFPDYRTFQNVIAHELVHMWQYHYGDEGEHNDIFWTFKAPLAKLGYTLEETY